MKYIFFFILLSTALLTTSQSAAQLAGEVDIDFKGFEQSVLYNLYLPKNLPESKKIPVIICSGGVTASENGYLHSSPRDCHGPKWKKFADKNNMAILGLGFLVIEDDWKNRQSYQFPQAWSGRAVEKILTKLSTQYPINPKHLYMFGISGGAQFSLRFAFYRPKWVKGVAAHAAGSYDPPLKKITTQFLITVGELDDKEVLRKTMAEEFADALQLFDIPHKLLIVKDIAHEQTEQQNKKSRTFFRSIKNNQKNTNLLPDTKDNTPYQNVSLPMGLTQDTVLQQFPRITARTRRKDKKNLYLTYFYGPQQTDFLTLHFKNNILFNWALNARHEIIDEYLSEFISGGIIRDYPKTFQAIQNALKKLPQEPFAKVINRDRPVIFIDTSRTGIARYANAIDFYFQDDDPPAFRKGFYLIKLGRDLEKTEDVESIEGIIFHELTHHILDHLRGPVDCDTEREANQLVKSWGFAKEIQKASNQFGAKSKKDSPCYGK